MLAAVVELERLPLMNLAEGTDPEAAQKLLFVDEPFEAASEPLP